LNINSEQAALESRDQRQYYFGETLTRQLIIAIARLVFWLFTRLEVTGLENLPTEGGIVLAPNYLTNFDVFPIQLVLPRLIFFMGKEELFRQPLMDAVLRRLGGFPVKRGAHDEWAIHHAQEVLQRGLVLGIFPEGKRNLGKGLAPAKSGAARLAIGTGCPVVPVAIQGTQQMFKIYSKRISVVVKIGVPIYPSQTDSILGLTDTLMFSLA
jgi:1-acyl-sn-glycerol-3-phosphate acyltransferase